MTITHCSHSTQAPGVCCQILGRWDNRCGRPATHTMDFLHADGARIRHFRCEEHAGGVLHPAHFETSPLDGAA